MLAGTRSGADDQGMDPIRDLLIAQHGVVGRSQALEAGLEPAALRDRLRRRELVRMHKGVYLARSGPPDWLQRAWAAVLAVEPAALWGPSALRAVRGPGLRAHSDRAPIHVGVDGPRPATRPSGVVIHRVPGLQDRADWGGEPPRMRLEEATLDVAATAADDHEAVTALAEAVHARLATPGRMRDAIRARDRIPRRRLIGAILDDAVAGSCTALERAYLDLVQAPHGLPDDRCRIAPSPRGPAFGEVRFDGRLVVELDGSLDHARFGDPAAAPGPPGVHDDHTVVRLGWGQVAGRPCDAAIRIDRLLRVLNITSGATPCPACRWRGIWAA